MLDKINIVFGTTASGKTKYGVQLAKQLNGVVINCDSMQVYQEIPILTAQPTLMEQQCITHKLYGYVSCLDKYSVQHWLASVIPVINDTIAAGFTPILVGGTGMYIKALMEGMVAIPNISAEEKEAIRKKYNDYSNTLLYQYLQKIDPPLANRYKLNDRQRILRAIEVYEVTEISLSTWQQKKLTPYFSEDKFHLIFVQCKREQIYRNINERFDLMIYQGVVEEVRRLYDKAGSIELPRAHGLREIISFINGDITLNEAIKLSKQITRNYAKRQLTWARHQFKEHII